MKIFAVLTLLPCLALANDAELNPEGDPERTPIEELKDIGKTMRDLADQLHEDRTDKPVQLVSQEIIARLEKLIKDADGDAGGKSKDEDKQWRWIKTGDPSARDIKPKVELYKDPAMQGGVISLPAAQRDAILQADRIAHLPQLWRERIMAYFVSVAADQAKEPVKAK